MDETAETAETAAAAEMAPAAAAAVAETAAWAEMALAAARVGAMLLIPPVLQRPTLSTISIQARPPLPHCDAHGARACELAPAALLPGLPAPPSAHDCH